jgi:hypothetical protein
MPGCRVNRLWHISCSWFGGDDYEQAFGDQSGIHFDEDSRL